MKKYRNNFILLILVLLAYSCKKISQTKQSVALTNYAAFDWFTYKGQDEMFNKAINPKEEFLNPILSGFYPDPSICAANGKFYLITSTFSYFPGIPIFESTDLVNWKQIGHVITRKEQGDFSGANVSEGMFAPTIRYNKGIFYVICTNVNGSGNFIVTAKDPAGPWSDPISLPEVNGIDPDIFFDDNGKVYITHNGPPPNNISLHDGHRAIYMLTFDLKSEKITSEPKLLVNGGTDMAKKPVWIEAPHIIKKDNFYYLICAEGGTAYNHSEVVFRSENVDGPYVSYENNPILTQRNLNPNRENEITTTGHADFVKLENGDWWAVFLGCRPYEDDMYNTGRETFLMPVQWIDGWPTIIGGNDPIPIVSKKPNLKAATESINATTGNFEVMDDFNDLVLDAQWNFIRTPLEKWHELQAGKLYIKPRNESIHTQTNFSFIGRRQQHQQFETATKVTYKLSDSRQAVGLVAFQNEKHYLLLGKRLNLEGKTEVFLERCASNLDDKNASIIRKQVLETDPKDLFLKIEGENRYYSFYYKTKENAPWVLLEKGVDASVLSTKIASGFVGAYLAMYTSLNHFQKQ